MDYSDFDLQDFERLWLFPTDWSSLIHPDYLVVVLNRMLDVGIEDCLEITASD